MGGGFAGLSQAIDIARATWRQGSDSRSWRLIVCRYLTGFGNDGKTLVSPTAHSDELWGAEGLVPSFRPTSRKTDNTGLGLNRILSRSTLVVYPRVE